MIYMCITYRELFLSWLDIVYQVMKHLSFTLTVKKDKVPLNLKTKLPKEISWYVFIAR